MNANRLFRVAMIGLPESEQRILKSLARISAGRPCSYEFAEFAAEAHADIAIIDGDSPEALRLWQGARRDQPAIFFSGREIEGRVCLKRPIMGARLMALLDDMAARLGAPPPAPAGTTPAISATVPAGGRQARLALVVDDSPTVRKHVELGLAPFGLGVEFAETGEQALELLAARTYDIVFLDVVLPGIDGYAVCKSIKKSKDSKATPVIMLTGKSSTFDRIKGSLAGCDTYLTKPVDYQVFQDTVRKFLGTTQGTMPTSHGG